MNDEKDSQTFFLFRHESLVLLILCALEITFNLLYLFPKIELNPYFTRDVMRAQAILDGAFIYAGPDTMGGGYSPGPFFYYLLTPILLISKKLEFVIASFLVLRPLSQVYFSKWLTRVTRAPALFTYLLLSAFLFLSLDSRWLTNASFIPVLLPFALSGLYRFYHSGTKWSWVIAAGLLGLFMQVHFSFAYLIILQLALLFIVKKIFKERTQFIILAAAVIAVSISPYLYALLKNLDELQATGTFYHQNYSDHSFFIKRWGRSFSLLFNHEHGGISYEPWSEVIEIFAFSFYIILRPFFFRTENDKTSSFIKSLALVAFVGVVLMIGFSLSSPRYLTVFYYLAIALLVKDLWGVVKTTQISSRVVITAVLLLLAVDRAFEVVEKRRCSPCSHVTVADAKITCDYFNQHGLSFEEFRFSSFEYYVQLGGETSFVPAASCFKNSAKKLTVQPFRYLFVNKRKLSEKDIPKIHERLPEELQNDFSRPLQNYEFETPNYIIYKVKNNSLRKDVFLSNLAYAYERDPLVDFGSSLKNGQWLKTQVCEDPFFCGVFVNWRLNGDDTAEVYIVSRLLQTKWDLPPVTARMRHLKLNYLCQGNQNSVDVAALIGRDINPEDVRGFTTPAWLKLSATCKDFRPLSLSAIGLDIFTRFKAVQVLDGPQEFGLKP